MSVEKYYLDKKELKLVAYNLKDYIIMSIDVGLSNLAICVSTDIHQTIFVKVYNVMNSLKKNDHHLLKKTINELLSEILGKISDGIEYNSTIISSKTSQLIITIENQYPQAQKNKIIQVVIESYCSFTNNILITRSANNKTGPRIEKYMFENNIIPKCLQLIQNRKKASKLLSEKYPFQIKRILLPNSKRYSESVNIYLEETGYTTNKKCLKEISKTIALQIATFNNNTTIIDALNNSKKKDDISDSYLMNVYEYIIIEKLRNKKKIIDKSDKLKRKIQDIEVIDLTLE